MLDKSKIQITGWLEACNQYPWEVHATDENNALLHQIHNLLHCHCVNELACISAKPTFTV